MADHLLSLDLGKMNDYSALAVVRRSLMLTPDGLPVRDHRRQTLYKFEVVALKRWPKFTPYPDIIRHVKEKIVPLPQVQCGPRLVIDASGVGVGIVDMVLDARPGVPLIPVIVTGGSSVRWARWPRSQALGCWAAKEELVSSTQYALQSDRLLVYPTPRDPETGLDAAAVLRDELKGFTVKMTRSAHEVYSAREGAHDDVLLAVALAVFVGMQPRVRYDAAAPVAPEAAGLAAEMGRAQEREQLSRRLARVHDEAAAFEAAQRADAARQQNPFDRSWDWRAR